MVRLMAQRECCRQTVEAGVAGRQTEPQQVAGAVKASAPYVLPRQCAVQLRCVGTPGEAKQRRAADDRKSALHKNLVKFARLLGNYAARPIGPWLVAQRGRADVQCRAGARPRAECSGDAPDHIGRTDRKPEAQPGKAIEFAERAQDHHRQIGAHRHRADVRIDIGEGLIKHQPATAVFQSRSSTHERGATGDASIGIVGVDDDDMNGAFGHLAKIGNRDDVAPSLRPGGHVLAIGRPNDSNLPRRRKIRQPLDQHLRSGSGSDVSAIGYVIGFTSGGHQGILIGTRRQALPYANRQSRGDRPRLRVDSSREVKPIVRRTAMARDRFGQVTTMLHTRFMPSSASKREGLRSGLTSIGMLACVMLICAGQPGTGHAADLPRVASINLCTDQLLMTLADPEQILGLSPYSRDAARSWDAAKASKFPRLSGEAEDVLVLNPDIVVAGRFTKRATRELLKEKGLRVVEFDAARSLDDVKKQIWQMGDLVQHPERAAAEIQRLDAAIARAREVVSRRPYRVLALSRRGWVSGGDSLTSSLLATAGLSNAAADLGYKLGGFASLEAIVSLRPDFLLVSDGGDFAEDEGRAFMLHPALERFYPASKRLVIPEKLTVCGGSMLSEALDRLTSELERVAH